MSQRFDFIRSMSLFCCWLVAICALSARAQVQIGRRQFGGSAQKYVKPIVELKTQNIFVRGFPAIVEISVRGSATVAPLSVFSSNENLRVDFTSQSDGRKYSILSADNRGLNMTAIGPDGAVVDGSFLFAKKRLWAYDDGVSVLIDLSSQSNIWSEGASFSQIPAGKYKMQIVLHPDLQSSPVDVQIRLPSLVEQKFLNVYADKWFEALSPEKQKRVVSRGEMKWNDVLMKRVPLADSNAFDLSGDAQQLMAFHVMLSALLRFNDDLKKFDVRGLERIAVPKYLRRQKQSLILEVAILQGQEARIQKRIERFLAQSPQFWWRISNARNRTTDFLEYRK